MDTVVVSVGGSVLGRPDEGLTGARSLGRLLASVDEVRLGVVAGGGAVARGYIQPLREAGLDEFALDEVGILATRLNAWAMLAHMPRAYPRPALTVDEAAAALATHGLVVMGGTHPGHTTDAVAAFLAERARAKRLVNVTNVDGVYDKDPRANKDARLLERVTSTQLLQIVGSGRAAGGSGIMDPTAAQVVHRSRVPLRVVSAGNADNVRGAILGQPFKGTEVTPG